MPPITRRLVAQQEAGEVELASSSMNSSLRSFFPLEVVNLILRELNDPPSLAALCLVSLGCLEEDSGQLYRDVSIRSERGLVSFTCGVPLHLGSRLIPHLSLNQTRTLKIDALFFKETTIVPFFVENRGATLPPRLATPLHLDNLTISAPPKPEPTTWVDVAGPFKFYLLYLLPHLLPTRVTINAGSPVVNPQALYLFQHNWTPPFRAWSDSLCTLSFDDWLPCGSMGDRSLFLEPLPKALKELEINVASWPQKRSRILAQVLRKEGVFELVGIRTKVVVAKSEEQLWKDEIATLDDEQRERVELVAV